MATTTYTTTMSRTKATIEATTDLGGAIDWWRSGRCLMILSYIPLRPGRQGLRAGPAGAEGP